MKKKILAFVMLATACVAAFGVQSKTDQGKADVAKKEPLSFIKTAADIALNVQRETVSGSLSIYVSEQNWAAALKDGDLGPFLKVKEAKAGRSAVCFFTESKNAAVCVYFDGDAPLAVAAVKAGASGSIQAGDISAAVKPVAKEMLKKGVDELDFTHVEVATDDGQQLPAYAVAVATKSAN